MFPVIGLVLLLVPLGSPDLSAELFFVTFLPLFVALIPDIRETRRERRAWKKIHPIDPPHYTPPRLAIEGSAIAFLALFEIILGALFFPSLIGFVFIIGIVMVASGAGMAFYARFFSPHHPTRESIGEVAYVAQRRALLGVVPFLLGLLGAVIVSAALQGQPLFVITLGWITYVIIFGALLFLLVKRCLHSSRKLMVPGIEGPITPPNRRSLETGNDSFQPKTVDAEDLEWCPNCSMAVPRSSKVCPRCGKTLKELGSV